MKLKLKQIATINAGYPFRGKILEVPGSDVLAVQMKDVSLTEGVIWSDCLETELTGKREPRYLDIGDILVAARGSHNYVVEVDQGLAATGKHAVASPHFFVISIKKKCILPQYLVWLLNQVPAQRYFEQNSEGTLTKSIRRSVLENALVVVPPIVKQQAIVSMANTLSEEQKLIQKLISNGELMMNAIAKDLFENKEVKL